MHINVIEKPLACKVKWVRYVRRKRTNVEPLQYRFRKTYQELRRSRLRWYRLTHGKPYLWPPMKGSEEDLAFMNHNHDYEGSERWSPEGGDEVYRNGKWEKK